MEFVNTNNIVIALLLSIFLILHTLLFIYNYYSTVDSNLAVTTISAYFSTVYTIPIIVFNKLTSKLNNEMYMSLGSLAGFSIIQLLLTITGYANKYNSSIWTITGIGGIFILSGLIYIFSNLYNLVKERCYNQYCIDHPLINLDPIRVV